MTMEQAVHGVFDPMTPRAGAEDRMWRAIDQKLGGRAKEVRICIHRRKRSRASLLLTAAAVLVLLLVSVFYMRSLSAQLSPPEPVAAVPTPTPSPTPEPTPEPTPLQLKETRQIALVNARVDDSPILSITDEGVFLARAVLPEGMTVDHWELNGEPADAGDRCFTLEFESSGVKSVEAVLREERRVTCVNAYLQFLDEDGNPTGWMYEDVCFEYDYEVPTTGESCPGGCISAYVKALSPSEDELDYWLIDGERVEADVPARGIRLENWDRSIRIEAVMRHGHRKRDLGPEIVFSAQAPEKRGAAPADDTPAGLSAAPVNALVEVDYERDGVPFDPKAPARDGHTHDWVKDQSRSWDSSCNTEGRGTMVCSICGREYSYVIPRKEHQYRRETRGQYVYDVCVNCGYEWPVSINMGGGSGGSVIGDPVPTPSPAIPVIGWDP